MKKLIYMFLTIVTLAGIVMVEGGQLSQYISVSAFLVVTLGMLFSTLFSCSFQEILNAFRDSFSETLLNGHSASYKKSCDIARNMAKLSMLWGWVGVLLGMISVLGNARSLSEIGVPISMCLTSMLYGLLYSCILFLPMSHRLQLKWLGTKDLK